MLLLMFVLCIGALLPPGKIIIRKEAIEKHYDIKLDIMNLYPNLHYMNLTITFENDADECEFLMKIAALNHPNAL